MEAKLSEENKNYYNEVLGINYKDIREKLKKLQNTTPPVQQSTLMAVKPKKNYFATAKKNHFMTIFLGTVMFLLSLMLMFLVVSKLNSTFASELPVQEQPQPYVYSEKPEYTPSPVAPDNNSRDIEKLKASVKQLSHQVWVLSVQGNQNAAVVKQMDTEFHNGKYAPRFVYIQENWKLDHKPDAIRFDEEGLKRLQEYLNN